MCVCVCCLGLWVGVTKPCQCLGGRAAAPGTWALSAVTETCSGLASVVAMGVTLLSWCWSHPTAWSICWDLQMAVETPCIWKTTSPKGVTRPPPNHSCCYRLDSPVWFVACSGCASLPSISVGLKLLQVSDVLERWEFTPPALLPAVPCAGCEVCDCSGQPGLRLELSGVRMSSREVVLAEGRSSEFACCGAVLSGLCWIIRLASWIFLMTLSSCSEQLLLSCGRMA